MTITRHGTALILFLVLLTGVACQTNVVVITEPNGMDIYAGSTRLGRTPISLSRSSLESSKTASGYLLHLEKPGYQRVWLLVPDRHRAVRAELNVRPLAASPDQMVRSPREGADSADQRRRYYIDSAKLLNLQASLVAGETINPKTLADIKQSYPASGSAYLLEGLALYEQGEHEAAVKALELAVERNPAEEEFHAVLNAMRKSTPTPPTETP